MEIAGQTIQRQMVTDLEIPVGRLYDFTEVTIPIRIIAGRDEGPVLFVCAALHGDEINGVECIRRILKKIRPERLRGTLIAIPIVNIFGFNTRSRYLPDRRDLNRCFPGSNEGSLGSRVAHAFLEEIVSKSTHGIDLHTGTRHKYNLPQVRGDLSNPEVLSLAHAFGAPVILNSNARDGSLREAVKAKSLPILVYEGGEALRFNEEAIRTAFHGILNVMDVLNMYKVSSKKVPKQTASYIANSCRWVRATHGGIFKAYRKAGQRIDEGDVLGVVTDPFGDQSFPVIAPQSGLVVGQALLPLVNLGDALFNVASFDNIDDVIEMVEVDRKDHMERRLTRENS